MIIIILSALIIMLASLSGVIFASKNLSTVITKNLHYLVSLSAGMFLVISITLSTETIEHGGKMGILWIIIGLISTWLILKLIPESHHHHENNNGHIHNNIDARRIVIADGIHNIGDGILLASAFAVHPTFGFITAGGILIHEVLEEISEYFVMKEAGWNTKKILTINLITSSTILFGAIGAYFLIDMIENIEGILLGLAGGVFLVVVFHDLIPHSIRDAFQKKELGHTFKHIVWFAVGLILMSMVQTLLPHEHEEGQTNLDHDAEILN